MHERSFVRLAETVEGERRRLGGYGDWPPAGVGAIFLAEVAGSTALAGSTLAPPEIAMLLERGAVARERPFEHYVLVADYAEAAREVRGSPPAGPRRPFLRLQEIVDLHALAVRRSLADTPGKWRAARVAPFESGMVAPPPWAVPQAVATFVDRRAAGPPASVAPLLWVAQSHEAFERIHPFATANGRVGRLVANLLLRRLGYPPLVLPARDAARYLAALRRADSGDPWPLAILVARSILASFAQLAAASVDPPALLPLREFASAAERPALYKAAQRGRLRSLRRNGSLLTTQAWLDAYRSETRSGPTASVLLKAATRRARSRADDADDSRDARPL